MTRSFENPLIGAIVKLEWQMQNKTKSIKSIETGFSIRMSAGCERSLPGPGPGPAPGSARLDFPATPIESALVASGIAATALAYWGSIQLMDRLRG